MVLKLVVIGAGSHSRTHHLPSLALYARDHPGEIELSALCDLQGDLAASAARQFGFARAYTDCSDMLRRERPDGCVAVTPIEVTARVARQVMEARVPLCMEKPPGATLDEARELAEWAERRGAPVMVSVNRRFDPALCAAKEWWAAAPIEMVDACLARTGRPEPFFITDTAIHAIDAIRFLAGHVSGYDVEGRLVDGVRWFMVQLAFESGATGMLEVMPTTGAVVESYELSGVGRRAACSSGFMDTGSARCWEDGRLVRELDSAPGTPGFVRAGSYAETSAFIEALAFGGPLHPTPAEVLPSVELCYAIDAAFPL